MFTIILAIIDTVSVTEFQLLYLGTFIIDIAMWTSIGEWKNGRDQD